MILLPAIDIQNGTCVRLKQGNFSTAEKVAEDYMEAARRFEDAGAQWVHMVDLDGAKAGHPVNQKIYETVAQKTHLCVEVGGGVRNAETIETYLQSGVARVILGSAALKNPELVTQAVARFGSEHIAVGIDSRGGFVASQGWLETSHVPETELLCAMKEAGVRYFIVTDIARDGTLAGPNLEQLAKMQKAAGGCHIIASGGVRDLRDIQSCMDLGLYGVICGKSIYKGTLDLMQAVCLARGVGQC